MEKKLYFGIDFGTTNTAVTVIFQDEKGRKPKNLGENGEYPFSSIVAIPKDGSSKLLFGREVKRQRNELSQTHAIFTSMKSYLGTDYEFTSGENRYNAIEITTEFLKYIKQYIKDVHKFDITDATFSFPVDFSPNARHELKLASINAGINPNGFVNEATAAYVLNSRKAKSKALSKVLVVDWGGGTLDVSVLGVKKNILEELSVYGLQVGGDDVDLEMAKWLHSQIASSSDVKIAFDDMSPENRDKIISLCEVAKIDFSSYDDDYSVTIQNYGEYGTKTHDFSYSVFDDIVKSIVTSKVLDVIETALQRAGVPKASVDGVIVVGGSSNIRPFANVITNIFGEEKIIIPKRTDWAVATGTAVIDIVGATLKLNSSLGLMMSDGTPYILLKKHEHGVGSTIDPITFALVEDAEDARFIFVNEEGQPYTKEFVKTKGFLCENLVLSAKITDVQIANITIKSMSTGVNFEKEVEINKLTFYYDLQGINNL